MTRCVDHIRRRTEQTSPLRREIYAPERMVRLATDLLHTRTAPEREIVDRFYRQGQTNTEIAGALGLSVSEVHNVRIRLREDFDRYVNDRDGRA